MYKPLLLLFFFCFLGSLTGKAQGINSVYLRYSNPGVTNDTELIANIGIPSQPVSRISNSSWISNDTLYVRACYFAGIQTAPTQLTDTIQLGPIVPNLTTLHFKISYSVSPQCNVVNSATKIQAFAIVGSLGMKPAEGLNSSAIFPNPAGNTFWLKDATVNQLSIYDATGKLIQSRNFKAETNLKVDVSFLPKGLYFIRAVTENGKVINQQLLKE